MRKRRINKNNIIIVLLACLVIGLTMYGMLINSALKEARQGRTAYKYSEELDDVFFPFDENKAKLIDESTPNADGETWAIYMYLNASNLENDGYSQLSPFVEYLSKERSDARIEDEKEHAKELFTDYIKTGEKYNVPLPLSFYDADYIKGDTADLPEEHHEVSDYCWGSDMLESLRNAEFPENVTFVVQPGGARAWRDVQVNPNRTRRFVKSGSDLVEVYDAPVTNMGDSETLTDFLNYCKANYPADHTMVILTDHGGAMTGFGWDNVFKSDNLTLKELTKAFDDAYGIDEENPAIDLLYYNACLMSNTDVINSMRGVCKYMIAGEDVGYSETNYYVNLATKLSENPNMNTMQLGKALIDSYASNLVESGAQAGAPPATGLSMLDMSKATKVYDAYDELAGAVLGDVADNPQLLGILSRNVAESVSFGTDSYRYYNVTDLGLWADQLEDIYPDNVKNINELIDQAVIYKRVDGYLKDAKGISVYYPNYVDDIYSLKIALNYIEDISYSKDISALYYYKLAGCMNEEYTAYCKEKGIKVPEVIDYGAMSILRNSEITAVDDIGNVTATIDESVFPILTDVRFELSKVDEDMGIVTCYGEDRFVGSDGGNGIKTAFEGKWVNIGGTPFYVNVINTYENTCIYESPVIYKDFEHKLMIQCDIDEEGGADTFTILGLRHHDDEAATIDRNVDVLMPGSYITPIYYESDIKGGRLVQTEGLSVLYNINTRIQDEPLTSGQYRVRIVYEDMRGDKVYSNPVYFDVN